jgi:hypothetical protein
MIITARRLVVGENPAIVEIYKKLKKKTQFYMPSSIKIS